MILRLNKHPQEAVVVIDAMGNSLSYGELVGFSKEITTLMPPRSLLFLLTENTVGGVAWSIGCINSGNVPLVLNAHIEEGLYKNLFDISAFLFMHTGCIGKYFFFLQCYN